MKHLCVVLHDVSPVTWRSCRRLLELIDGLGSPRVTLLVVPNFHGLHPIDGSPQFVADIEARLARGDELVLHGYTHRDDAPPPKGPLEWIRRRVLTAGEGEFSALSQREATRRLERGLEIFSRLGWPVAGFVPPAWLASKEASLSLRDSGMRFTSSHTALVALPSGTRLAAPCLTVSARSAWRRHVSKTWLRTGIALTSSARVVRVGLHPQDASHEDVVECWKEALVRLLDQREPVTKSRALALMQASTAAAPHHA
jgi:predicted deacetylase